MVTQWQQFGWPNSQSGWPLMGRSRDRITDLYQYDRDQWTKSRCEGEFFCSSSVLKKLNIGPYNIWTSLCVHLCIWPCGLECWRKVAELGLPPVQVYICVQVHGVISRLGGWGLGGLPCFLPLWCMRPLGSIWRGQGSEGRCFRKEPNRWSSFCLFLFMEHGLRR